jgi:hypothetical protein
VRIAGWAERLFSMGFDPYAPLRNNEQRPLDMIIGHLHVKLAEQTVNPAVVNYYELNKYWRGANTLQRLLKTYATAKDSETLVKVHQMVKILVNSNINLEFTDADGLSITDYLSEYKWIDTDVGLLFYGKYMPALSGKKYVNPYKRLGRKINPSPFADYMFRERYGIFSDGLGGTYESFLEYNSNFCDSSSLAVSYLVLFGGDSSEIYEPWQVAGTSGSLLRI